MTTSVKLGVASLIALVVSGVLEASDPDGVFGIGLLILSVILGFLAGWLGNRWWMAVPTIIVVFFGLILLAGYHAI